MKGPSLPWEEKHVQPDKWEEGKASQQAATTSPAKQWAVRFTVISQTQTTFPSKTLMARGAGKETENFSTQGRGLVSVFSRKIILEKVHNGDQFKWEKGCHSQRFSTIEFDKNHKIELTALFS